jgi:Ribosomal protein S14
MAKVSMINREIKRQKLVQKFTKRRSELKEIVKNRELPMEERFKAQIKLAKLPPNSSPTRLHNRCKITGRPKAFYRKLQMSRIALRDLASRGEIPGMIKSTWYRE